VRKAEANELLLAALLELWPERSVARWQIVDEAVARDVPYEDLWLALTLLKFRIVAGKRPDGTTAAWHPPPRQRPTRVSPAVFEAFVPVPPLTRVRSVAIAGEPQSAAPLAHRSPTSRERTIAILQDRFPCRRAPHGTWDRIAKELGVSGERVRQFAVDAGWSVFRVGRPMYQCACGRTQQSAKLCSACRYVELPCEQCGKPQRRSAETLAWRVAKFPRPQRYSGRVFCGRSCFGRWVGITRVGRFREEKIERVKERLERDYPSRRVPHGTWRTLARELVIDYSWLCRTAAELGWEIQTGLKAELRGTNVHG
jgi:hypothetical protein